MWLEECIDGPSMGLKHTAHVSFFQRLCSFLMTWRILFLNTLMYTINSCKNTRGADGKVDFGNKRHRDTWKCSLIRKVVGIAKLSKCKRV